MHPSLPPDLQSALSSASTRNTQLLHILSATDHAGPVLEPQRQLLAHLTLAASESDKRLARFTERRIKDQTPVAGSTARTDFCMPAGANVYYFEVTIEKLISAESEYGNTPAMSVGFCEEHASLSGLLGSDDGGWRYDSADGHKYSEYGVQKYDEPYAEGAVTGCGVDFRTHTAFFTRDGKFLGQAFTEIRGKLYPAISFGWNVGKGSCVSANFGNDPEKNFMFDLAGLSLPANPPDNGPASEGGPEPDPSMGSAPKKTKRKRKTRRRRDEPSAWS
ncbi:concanavalin A-like lectin/glucanase domain-containing protein [Cercophora newfieldiana]|uniref:Concanavalin A-like lectin/glucanase domain-containing protein n=1 Tax=Cercophora newfieldiana TaxID=92897 RepID=A0AA39Y9J8_9PEZI|nr:concanavalin A-like lectin/glucanase domain-containing protein [Cercophora newfieldiana]